MNCREVDELGAAFALGAVDSTERAAIAEHLETCREPHAETRSLLAVAPLVGLDAAPVQPSSELRDRVISAVARTPQEPAVERRAVVPPSREGRERGWLAWLSPQLSRPLAAGAMAAALVLAVVSGGLWLRVQESEDRLRTAAEALAGGEVAFRVTGDAGAGYLVQSPTGEATLIVGDIADLPDDALYELWLIDAEGRPVDVGTFRPGDDGGLAIVPLESDLAGYAVFAVTVERERVDAPTGEPVLSAPLDG